MSSRANLDSRGSLLPMTNGHLDIIPNPVLVNSYANWYTYRLVREAKDGTSDIEVFSELYRRAAESS